MAESEEEEVMLSVEDQNAALCFLLETALDTVIHDILLEVHQDEKVARMHTASIELEDKATKMGRKITADPASSSSAPDNDDAEPIETKAATLESGLKKLKGNPMETVKHIRCPNCKLRRLLYPRVGFNARPVPDPTESYCKQEPMIIIDKHDVHGQRKKGVKVKGQAKGKNKKNPKNNTATDPPSPAASENSEPVTPLSSLQPESFEFKEIDFPAAKCPNRESHLGDHWKAVNIFATHLNGSCYLKKDRVASRDANAKIGGTGTGTNSGGTPRDSRANSPKAAPTAVAVNGVKRKAAAAAVGGDDDQLQPAAGPPLKKKKLGDLVNSSSNSSSNKKTAKGQGAVGVSSKLRESETNRGDDDEEGERGVKIKMEANGDTIQVTPKGGGGRDGSSEPVKLKFSVGGGGSGKDKEKEKEKEGKVGKKMGKKDKGDK